MSSALSKLSEKLLSLEKRMNAIGPNQAFYPFPDSAGTVSYIISFIRYVHAYRVFFSARLLANASVKTARRVEIIGHSPDLANGIFIFRR